MRAEILRELATLLPRDRITTAPEDLVAYSFDGYAENLLPEVVVFPTTTEEVAAILRVAYREEVPVTPRGAGTNVAGESVASRGGIVLCLTQMDKILSIDARSLTATVQAGVIPFDLQKEADKVGLMYPPDPSTWTVATMGGTVATNAGGPRTLKYGVTKDYLLGVTAVLADGEVLKTGGGTLKNATGYNLTALLCGSEGTLAVITEITARLVPKPAASRTLRADFLKIEDCSDAVAAIMAGGIIPAALEFMDQFVVSAVEQAFHLGLPTDAAGMLLVQVDGAPETLGREVAHIERVLGEKRARNILVAEDGAQAEKLWLARRAAGPSVFRMKPDVITEDVTVPVAQFTTMVKKAVDICAKNRVTAGILAHAGDGNLHPCLLFDKRDAEEFTRVEATLGEMAQAAVDLGGTLSGEHGIGIAKAPFLRLELNEGARRVTRDLKRCFDPKGILNPGKFLEGC